MADQIDLIVQEDSPQRAMTISLYGILGKRLYVLTEPWINQSTPNDRHAFSKHFVIFALRQVYVKWTSPRG